MKSISIIGSCVTRDAFEYIKNVAKIDTYIARSSIISLVSEKPEFEIPQEYFEIEGLGNFERRMIEYDINKTGLEKLLKSETEYLFFDFIDERFDLYFKNKNYITKSNYLNKSKITDAFLSEYELIPRKRENTHNLWKESLLKLKDIFEKNNKNFKIILNEAKWAEKFLNPETKEIKGFNAEELKTVARYNSFLQQYQNYFKMVFPNCLIIKADENLCYAHPNNKWGVDYFHFSEDYYKNLGKKIIKIIDN
jgi:hypothetical protein